MAKGYQGAVKQIRAIHRKKKQPHRSLSLEDTRLNENVSSDRIIVERYFGRLCSFWAVLPHKYLWSESSHDMIFKLCLNQTKFHICINLLDAHDHDNA